MQDDWSMMIEETRIANEETRLEEDKRLAFIAKARALNTPRKEKVSITGNKHIPQPVIKVLAAFTHVTPSRVE